MTSPSLTTGRTLNLCFGARTWWVISLNDFEFWSFSYCWGRSAPKPPDTVKGLLPLYDSPLRPQGPRIQFCFVYTPLARQWLAALRVHKTKLCLRMASGCPEKVWNQSCTSKNEHKSRAKRIKALLSDSLLLLSPKRCKDCLLFSKQVILSKAVFSNE